VLQIFTPDAVKFEFITLKDLRESKMSFGDVVDWLLGMDYINDINIQLNGL